MSISEATTFLMVWFFLPFLLIFLLKGSWNIDSVANTHVTHFLSDF